MVLLRRIFFSYLAFFSTLPLAAQILDDSTKTVYGPETTFYTYEEYIKYNRRRYFPLDTGIAGMHDFRVIEQYENKLQNLGNIGTAAHPIFYQPPEIIGKRSGFEAYDYYFTDPDQIKYYDTKSPYTDVNAIFGGNGRSKVNVIYTRNINERWNVGFDFHRMTGIKQLARQSSDDRQLQHTSYDIYSHYRSANDKYEIMGTFTRMGHDIQESGGIANLDTTLFLYEDAVVNLNAAESRDVRFNAHAYHQYTIDEKVQLYHEFDWINQKNSFVDDLAADGEFYDQVLINPDSTDDTFRTRVINNEFGFKGNIDNLFYSFFIQNRNVNFRRSYVAQGNVRSEDYGGFHLRWDFDSLSYLNVYGKYLLGGNHLLGSRWVTSLFDLEYKRLNYASTFIQDSYFNNHYDWQNDFSSPQSDNLSGSIFLKFGNLTLIPKLNFNLIKDHIYYSEDQTPRQADGFAQVITPGLGIDLTFWRNFHWNTEGLYTLITGPTKEVFNIPEIFVNSRFLYENILFNESLQFQVGLDFHYKSNYFGYAYNPVNQQFYLQDQFMVPLDDAGYLITDFFLNFKIGLVRLFLKMEHLNQAENSGYLITPLYTGPKRIFGFGVSWMFFD